MYLIQNDTEMNSVPITSIIIILYLDDSFVYMYTCIHPFTHVYMYVALHCNSALKCEHIHVHVYTIQHLFNFLSVFHGIPISAFIASPSFADTQNPSSLSIVSLCSFSRGFSSFLNCTTASFLLTWLRIVASC